MENTINHNMFHRMILYNYIKHVTKDFQIPMDYIEDCYEVQHDHLIDFYFFPLSIIFTSCLLKLEEKKEIKQM